MILTDRLGPDILLAFWTKGQVLHRERAHLKVPGFSIVLNVLLTRKIPTSLSRLNEISGGTVMRWWPIPPPSTNNSALSHYSAIEMKILR